MIFLYEKNWIHDLLLNCINNIYYKMVTWFLLTIGFMIYWWRGCLFIVLQLLKWTTKKREVAVEYALVTAACQQLLGSRWGGRSLSKQGWAHPHLLYSKYSTRTDTLLCDYQARRVLQLFLNTASQVPGPALTMQLNGAERRAEFIMKAVLSSLFYEIFISLISSKSVIFAGKPGCCQVSLW